MLGYPREFRESHTYGSIYVDLPAMKQVRAMLRTTIYLEEDMALAIRQLADAENRSQAEIIRDALNAYLQQAQAQSRRPLPPGIGAYRSGRQDISEQAEALLRQAARRRRS